MEKSCIINDLIKGCLDNYYGEKSSVVYGEIIIMVRFCIFFKICQKPKKKLEFRVVTLLARSSMYYNVYYY